MIEFRGVSKWYHTPHGRKIVLDGLDLTLPPGTKLGVLGQDRRQLVLERVELGVGYG